MLTERLVGESIRQSNRFVFNGAVLAAAVFVGVLGFVVQRVVPPALPAPAGEQMVALGRALVGPFGAALQLLAVLLVVALLGALYFARAED
jgi:NADH:ubiquinone oxidoreductase subunit 6 (subunit J)